MIHQIPAEITIHLVRPRLDAEALLERSHAKSKAFAQLAERIEPISPPAATGPAPARRALPSTAPYVVLMVDDEAVALTITALRLRRAGYDVFEASSGLEAVPTLESRGISALFYRIVI